MLNNKVIKIVSIAGSVLGIAGTMLSNFATEKNMEMIINEKVNEAIKNLNK